MLTDKKTNTIIERIRKSRTRWDGLMELKRFKVKHPEALLPYVNDKSWIIRWAVIEKIGNLKYKEGLLVLFEKLSDKDVHVVKQSQKAIEKIVKNNIGGIVSQLDNPDYVIRKFCVQYIRSNIKKHHGKLVTRMLKENWIISNRLLHIFFRYYNEQSEPILLKAIASNYTQRHAIMMLAIIKSQKAATHYVDLYKKPHLRRHIMQAIAQMESEETYRQLIECLRNESQRTASIQILTKLGEKVRPVLKHYIADKDISAEILKLLNKEKKDLSMYSVVDKKNRSTEPINRQKK